MRSASRNKRSGFPGPISVSHRKTGKPVLLADAAWIKGQTVPSEFTRNRATWNAETLAAVCRNPDCTGVHLCGACQRNEAGRYGLLMRWSDSERRTWI